MGFEHKIYCSLSDRQKDDIQRLLIAHDLFFRTIVVADNKFFEFRKKDKIDDELPEFNVVIEPDGLYICNYAHSSAWADIDFIKEYLLENHINIKIEEL